MSGVFKMLLGWQLVRFLVVKHASNTKVMGLISRTHMHSKSH